MLDSPMGDVRNRLHFGIISRRDGQNRNTGLYEALGARCRTGSPAEKVERVPGLGLVSMVPFIKHPLALRDAVITIFFECGGKAFANNTDARAGQSSGLATSFCESSESDFQG